MFSAAATVVFWALFAFWVRSNTLDRALSTAFLGLAIWGTVATAVSFS